MSTTHRRSPIIATLAAALLVLAVAAGCGIPTEATARPIDRNVLNQALVEQSTTTSTPADTGGLNRTAVLFLVSSKDGSSSELLAATKVPILNVVDQAEYPRQVIEQLIAEKSDGSSDLTNAIPPGTRVLNATKDGNVLDLDLSDLGQVESSRQRLAAAQIVYTATAIDGIAGVRFSIDGELAAVPLDDRAAEVGQIIMRRDYPNMLAP